MVQCLLIKKEIYQRFVNSHSFLYSNDQPHLLKLLKYSLISLEYLHVPYP